VIGQVKGGRLTEASSWREMDEIIIIIIIGCTKK
jgi:hypothetical protein